MKKDPTPFSTRGRYEPAVVALTELHAFVAPTAPFTPWAASIVLGSERNTEWFEPAYAAGDLRRAEVASVVAERIVAAAGLDVTAWRARSRPASTRHALTTEELLYDREQTRRLLLAIAKRLVVANDVDEGARHAPPTRVRRSSAHLNGHSLEDVARLFLWRRNRLVALLRRVGIFHDKTLLPRDAWVDSGYFRIVACTSFDEEHRRHVASSEVLVTAKGLAMIQAHMEEWLRSPAADGLHGRRATLRLIRGGGDVM
jgi:hypothetical protein